MGQTDGIDGVSNIQQPNMTSVTRNLFHETGIYIKQSAPMVQFLSRSSRFIGNIVFNAPRAGLNINDGFSGDTTVAGNAFFNTVRETSDHGPFNSWNRIPYLTGNPPSLIPLTNHIHHNLFFNSYSSVWPIDHDDGSAYYEDSFNVLVYGGYKNYLGHSKIAHDHLYIYPDGQRFDEYGTGITTPPRAAGKKVEAWGTNCGQWFAPGHNDSGWGEEFYNSICFMQASGNVYELDSCNTSDLKDMVPTSSNNTFYVPSGQSMYVTCTVNGQSRQLTLSQWQATGYDTGSQAKVLPALSVILPVARAMLGLGTRKGFNAPIPEQLLWQ